nr:MAG TPA: hypothetical protein [Caudoviricetes sp.]
MYRVKHIINVPKITVYIHNYLIPVFSPDLAFTLL